MRVAKEYDASVLDNSRKHGRVLVCKVCQGEGCSPQDQARYQCVGCGKGLGHQKFNRDALKNSKRDGRAKELVCIDCTARARSVEEKLKRKDAWKCTCGKSGKARQHSLNNEKCQLFPTRQGEKRDGKARTWVLQKLIKSFFTGSVRNKGPHSRCRRCIQESKLLLSDVLNLKVD